MRIEKTRKPRIAMTRKPDSKTAPAKEPSSRARPVTTLRFGRVKVAIWENKTDRGTFHNVTFSRYYRDEEGKFHDTDSYGRDDLPLIAKLADEAHTYIFRHLASKGSEEEQ